MTETLESLSNAIADTVETAANAVVRVEGRRRLPASGIIWDQDGLIITASHVLQRDEGIHVGLPDGERIAVELVGRDPTTDLAVLRSSQTLGHPPEWRDLSDVKVGHLVLALGRPGKTVQATMGVVSALGAPWRTPAGAELSRYLQTDVVMYPGFSGGPLVSANGGFVGLNTSALLRGVSMTVPADNLKSIADDLVKYGEVRRGYLGVSLQIVRLPDSVQSEVGQKTGLLVVGIEEGSPASKGDLHQGDVLVRASDVSLQQMDDLFMQLGGEQIGSKLPLSVIRAGELLEVDLEVGSRKQ